MASVRKYNERDEEKEVLRAWIDLPDEQASEDKVSLSGNCRTCLEDSVVDTDQAKTADAGRWNKTLKALLVEILSGREVRILDLSTIQGKQGPVEQWEGSVENENTSEQRRTGWGVEYSYQKSHYEKEGVVFSAAGIIRSEDGKETEFSLRLDMSREFVSHYGLNIRAGDALLMDPLVVNFNGKATALTDAKFSFDLDSDGVKEDVPVMGPGSGFLALDLNNDGIITTGSELFGPRTDDGFAELSEYDQDANSWIDENDPIYDQLSVWTYDNLGTSSLNSLRAQGIGAIYLGNLSSGFDLRKENNELMGQIRRTGVFLDKDGKPGTIQQLDLVV